MDIDNAVAEFLEVEGKRAPAQLQPYYQDFQQLYASKLWHQLTLKVEDFTRQPEAEGLVVPLYEHFILDWEKKMNPVKSVLIALTVARQYHDYQRALDLLQEIQGNLDHDDTRDAMILAHLEAGHFYLLMGNLDATAEAMEKAEKTLDTFNTVDPVIHASFYRVSADYYKAKAEFAEYYKNALLYLACISLDTLSTAEKAERAQDLALAALLSDKIYNFGDLLMHPILDALKGTEQAWLCDILLAFNSGDIGAFETLSSHFSKQPILQSHLAFLRQKVCLMTLIEVMFKRISVDRRMSFEEIAKAIRLPLEEVEHLVMKALSLGLIRGSIDQVDQVVNVQWVQPRYLDKKQIRNMAEQLSQWEDKVRKIASEMEDDTPELFA
ncbi:26S proteasome regulatory subunit [Tieghemiomyces parasiticus]|uniref:26S proteasome regulatory subunit n=1 Tax=Tieghemiomyces parasiticus TaxID=78921 RepID=A0A9W8A7P4_9FUNG|nr:26S proteasome regulatory subunit [Tieghemiomyces parasiticus]